MGAKTAAQIRNESRKSKEDTHHEYFELSFRHCGRRYRCGRVIHHHHCLRFCTKDVLSDLSISRPTSGILTFIIVMGMGVIVFSVVGQSSPL